MLKQSRRSPRGGNPDPSGSKSNIRQPESPPRRGGLPIHPGPVFRLPSPVFCLLSPVSCPPPVLAYLTKAINHPEPFYAKQTQFPQAQNPSNLLCPKKLQQYAHPLRPKNKPKTNPILAHGVKLADSSLGDAPVLQVRRAESPPEAERGGPIPSARPENRPCIHPGLIYPTQTDPFADRNR